MMAANRVNEKNDERKQEEIRNLKIKTEYLKSTLKGLQSMLEAEKEKLKKEKGEVEGLAREKGLVLINPGEVITPEYPIATSCRQEYNQTPAISQVPLNPSAPPYQEPQQNINISCGSFEQERMDWSHGDTIANDYRTSGADCIYNSGVSWEPQHYGDYSSALWDRAVMNGDGDPCYLERDLNPEDMFNSGYLDDTLYGLQKTLMSFEYPSGFQTDMDNLLEDSPASFQPRQNLAALFKEVDHITQVIDSLEDP